MKDSQGPREWAKALFGLAQADGAVEKVDADLLSAISTLAGHAKLKETLADPRISGGKKAQIVAEIFGDSLSPLVTGALVTLAQGGDTSILPAIHAAYQDLSEEVRNVSIAVVTTAIPLEDDLRARLGAELKSVAGREVVLHEHVDASILGGVVVRMGGRVMDGSVRSRLAKLREQMVGKGSEA